MFRCFCWSVWSCSKLYVLHVPSLTVALQAALVKEREKLRHEELQVLWLGFWASRFHDSLLCPSLLNYAAGNLWKTDDAMPQQVRECKMAVTSLQAIHDASLRWSVSRGSTKKPPATHKTAAISNKHVHVVKESSPYVFEAIWLWYFWTFCLLSSSPCWPRKEGRDVCVVCDVWCRLLKRRSTKPGPSVCPRRRQVTKFTTCSRCRSDVSDVSNVLFSLCPHFSIWKGRWVSVNGL